MGMKRSRVAVIIIILISVMFIFILRLIKLQLIDGKTYAAQSQNKVVTKTIVKAPRGDILDRYCRPLVQNRKALTVEFNKTMIEKNKLNQTIYRVIKIFNACNQTYIDTFPILKTQPYVYDSNVFDNESKLAKFNEFLKSKKIEADMTADKSLEELIKYYKLDEYSVEDARNIIAIRYEIEMRSSVSFFTFANDINIETATMIKEKSDEIQGVYLEVEPVRFYTQDYFASHILGRVGRIYAEEYETLKEKGYLLDDIVGKEGIERTFEEYLRGENGVKYAQRDVTGTMTEIVKNIDPKPGNDIILTIDKNMQTLTEDGLAEIIKILKEQNGEEAASTGAVVFMDIHTGEVLSLASYPTYNLTTYSQDFAEVSQDPLKPYVNRAISGLFPPGSTFKMVAGIAGLEESVITPDTKYSCMGFYDYYELYKPTCIFGTVHGTLTLKDALARSCNCYFFDIARKVGIDKLNEYGKMLGFGELTGINIEGEKKGVLAGREYRISKGQAWQEGETLLAAIGQTDNNVTPLQLCNYIAIIANGGIRYRPQIVKAIRNKETGEILFENQPVITETLPIKQSTFEAVRKGLFMATQQGGSGYKGFQDFKMATVSVKTGTSEMPRGLPTTLIVGYAPSENPQIAFSLVVEHGGLDAVHIDAILIKDVLSYYFSNKDVFDHVPEIGELLS